MASKKKNFLKIVILGESGVGKTTLLQQYLTAKVPAHSKPTIGADFSKKEIQIDDKIVTLQIWDTAGQEKFQSLGYAFYRGADCCALVYDITSRKSFDALSKWRQGFIEHAGPDDPDAFPFVLIGNKIDKEPERQVPSSNAEQWCKQNGDIKYYETSAKENVSVSEAFVEMAKMALKREEQNLLVMPDKIGGAGGMKLSAKDDKRRTQTQVEKKMCEC